MFLKLSKENKKFSKLLTTLAIPIVFQEMLNASINLIDTVMVGTLGGTAITAVGLSNQIFFLFILVIYGINSGASIFMSQYWGKKDMDSIHRVMGISMSSGSVVSIFFGLISILFPHELISIYSKDPEVIRLGAEYLQIVAFSFFLMPFTICFNSALKSIGQTKLPMITSFFAVIINTVLNITLIKGLFGFPEMGVRGSATATLIARIVEIILLIWITYGYKFPIAASIKKYFSFDSSFLKRFYKTSTFILVNECIWALGYSLYNVAYREAGTEAQTAVQICGVALSLFTILSNGIGIASGIILGNHLGANELDTAKRYSKKLIVVMVSAGVVMGFLFIQCFPLIIHLFGNVTELVREHTMKITIIIGATLFLRCFNFLNVVGILRSGGDSKAAMYLDCFSVWCVGLPLTFIGAYVFHMPIEFLVLFATSEEFVKAGAGFVRYRTFKWVKNIVD